MFKNFFSDSTIAILTIVFRLLTTCAFFTLIVQSCTWRVPDVLRTSLLLCNFAVLIEWFILTFSCKVKLNCLWNLLEELSHARWVQLQIKTKFKLNELCIARSQCRDTVTKQFTFISSSGLCRNATSRSVCTTVNLASTASKIISVLMFILRMKSALPNALAWPALGSST